MTLDTTPGTGLERIQTEALMVLFRHLNDELLALQTTWDAYDQAIDAELGRARPLLVLEPVASGNFHLGHRPSLIEAPIDQYPNCSVMAYQSTPSGDQGDQFSIFNDSLYVELMVKSDSGDDDEDICNKRIQRAAQATINVMLRNRTLNGTILELQEPPSTVISDCFARKENTSSGRRWFWQGARLEFAFERVSTYY